MRPSHVCLTCIPASADVFFWVSPAPLDGVRPARPGPAAGSRRAAIPQRTGRHDHGSGQDQESRHQRPHRLGQDHADRADPLLHRAHPGHPRGEGQGRRRRHHGLHGPRARARHHHPERRHAHDVEGLPRQHHRHPGTRRLHHRGGARPEGARRRHPGAVFGGRRPEPVHHGRPPDAALQRAPHRVRQQVRPFGRQPGARDRAAAREAEAQRGHDADPDRARGQARGCRRPRDDEGVPLRGRQRREDRRGRDPCLAEGRGRPAPRGDARRRQHVQRRADGGAARRERHRGHDPRRGPQGRALDQADAGVPGQRLQEQGRAADARRRHALPAGADGHRQHGDRGHARGRGARIHAQPQPRGGPGG